MTPDLASLDLLGATSHSEADWREAVAKVLKGGSFELLRTPTHDGLTIEPLYPAARAAKPIGNDRGSGPWVVSQRIDHPDASDANTLALADLSGGASGLDLVFAGSPHARGHGLASDAIPVLLDGVLLDIISLRLDAGDASLSLAAAIAEHARARGVDPDRLDLAIIHDPIGLAARRGGAAAPLEQLVSEAALQATSVASLCPQSLLFNADGRIWHEAGANRVETLAAMLATAVTYWRALETAGLPVEAAAARIGFTLAIDQDQFSAMAEIRALRLLWANATAAAGLAAATARIHAETSLRMMSRLDANTNMLRTTIAAFAAGVGGADSLTVLPYTAAIGLPDAFARRLARNTQLILLEESNLGRVSDPAAGSGRIETETRALAEAAWGLFQQIEADGGIVASLRSGQLQARIIATATTETRAIARRKEALVGVSAYPLLTEPAVAILDVAPRPPATPAFTETIRALESRRLSEPYEDLRDTAAAAALKVFLANLGSAADFNPRSTWARNLFEVGGIATVGTDGFDDLDALVVAFKASGTNAVCLASSDAVYARVGLAALARLKTAGAGPIFFAGRPGEEFQEDSLRAGGVDVFLHMGQDAVAVLRDAQSRIAGRPVAS